MFRLFHRRILGLLSSPALSAPQRTLLSDLFVTFFTSSRKSFFPQSSSNSPDNSDSEKEKEEETEPLQEPIKLSDAAVMLGFLYFTTFDDFSNPAREEILVDSHAIIGGGAGLFDAS